MEPNASSVHLHYERGLKSGGTMALINGRPFHVVGAGCVVRRQGGRLVAYKDEELRASAPLTQISEVVLTGRVTITTPAMHALLAQDVP